MKVDLLEFKVFCYEHKQHFVICNLVFPISIFLHFGWKLMWKQAVSKVIHILYTGKKGKWRFSKNWHNSLQHISQLQKSTEYLHRYGNEKIASIRVQDYLRTSAILEQELREFKTNHGRTDRCIWLHLIHTCTIV